MLTTRNENVCSQMGVQKEFRIGILREQEAQSLFKEKVGDSIDTPEMHYVADEVCRECGGLPLAIVALGAALRNKNKHVWDDALEQLRNFRGNNIDGMMAKVYIPIELSFKYLEREDLRSCFLHCCLFPEDAEISIDDLMRYGLSTRFLQGMDRIKKARDRVQSLVQTLKTSCLLLEGRDENFIKMHDIIRDVAISIAAKEKEHMFLVKTGVQYWPEEAESTCWKTISLRSKNIVELPSELKYPDLRTLMLECNNPSLKVPNSFLQGMKKLEVLDLHSMRISNLEPSIPNIPNLRMLSLHRCNLTNLAFLEKLANLEILSLNGSYIDEVDAEVGKLTRLQILDLKNCVTLITFPLDIISNLSRLEELYVSDSFDEWEVEGSASLAELCSLPHLNNLEIHVPDHVILQCKTLPFERLSRFKISVGHRLEKHENLQGTKILKLVGISLKHELSVLIEKAEALYLTEVKGLKIVFHDSDRKRFLDLKWLVVENCHGMDYLFGHPNWYPQTQQLGPFAKLSVLKVCYCGLKYLFSPSTARCLRQLRELHISQCFVLEAVIGDTVETGDVVVFPQLEYIVLIEVPCFRSIYADARTASSSTVECECNPSTLPKALLNQKVSLPGLKQMLSGTRGERMEGVVNDLGSDPKMANLINMTTLQIYGLPSLQSIFSSSVAKNLLQLRQLVVMKCTEMEAVIAVEMDDESIVFPQLETIKLEDLPNLIAFCCSFESKTIANPVPVFFNHKISFPALKELDVTRIGRTRIISLWREAEGLRRLRRLVVNECDTLLSLAPSTMLQTLDTLVELHVGNCSSMACIAEVPDDDDDDILVFPQLKSLILTRIHNLTSFCSTLHFKAKAKEMSAALFNCKVKFPFLKALEIHSLKDIKEIWDNSVSTDSFCKLKELTVDDCDKLLNVASFKLLDSFQNLEQLTMRRCRSLKQVFKVEESNDQSEEVAVLPQLEKLTLEGLPCFTTFYSRSSNPRLLSSRPVTIQDCPSLGKISFPALKELHLIKLDSFVSIWTETGSFCPLTKLVVRGCDKLVTLAPVTMLQNLENLVDLHVSRCSSMVCIVEVPGDDEDDMMVFPRLKFLSIALMENLKSFSASLDSKGQTETVEEDVAQAAALFNHKVKFPVLEVVSIGYLQNFKEIWDDSVPSDAFCKLRELAVDGCDRLLNVASSKLLKSFQNLEDLEIRRCKSLKEVFMTVEASNEAEEVVAVLPQIKKVTLMGLPYLTCFYSRNCISSLPSSVRVTISDCPNFGKGSIARRRGRKMHRPQ